MDNGTDPKSYRSKVDLQIGDTTTNAATTTLQDTNVGVYWDSGKTLRTRSTQTTSWNLLLGTKIGTGTEATGVSGCVIFNNTTSTIGHGGLAQLYGCTIRVAGLWGISAGSAAQGANCELINCIFQSTATGALLFNMGAATAPLGVIYNCNFSSTAGTGRVINNFQSNAAERVTVGQSSVPFLFGVAASFIVKDSLVFGTPTTSDYRWLASSSVGAKLYRPGYTGNAPKFSTASAGTPQIGVGDSQTLEFREYDVKVVDRTGAGIASIPVTLTDVIGEVQVSTTTDSAGEITFGSGLATKMVKVMDHYVPSPSSTVYTQRHRSPFTVKINTSDLAGYNPGYLSRQYSFNWPGMESVTLTSGAFEDVNDVLALEEPSGNPTTWVEAEMP